ncbi:hypothetical protein AVEN_132216-1 [Araneus ventricosus]|uniref:Uncharacterized protein n=1 Tax=Araneus ventricosus TaxID=182803 RepID=A0A4Y2IKC3_ARAVE|nr:hypothetical protein AVEN_132216-1 [Araneus ventricosus]
MKNLVHPPIVASSHVQRFSWIQKIGREVIGVGIYYGIEGKATRLKSFNEIERYCREHKIHFDLFNFSGENTKSEKLTDTVGSQQKANVVEVRITTCYQLAIRSRKASEWCDAMDREINIMIEHKVWDFVDPPENSKVLGSGAYTLKRDENNRAVRFKARLVAQAKEKALMRLKKISSEGQCETMLDTSGSNVSFKKRSGAAIRVQPTSIARITVGVTRGSKRLVHVPDFKHQRKVNVFYL